MSLVVKVLVDLKTIPSKRPGKKMVYDHAADEFLKELSDEDPNDTYIGDFGKDSEINNVILGYKDPEKIIEEVKNWNHDICSYCIDSLKRIENYGKRYGAKGISESLYKYSENVPAADCAEPSNTFYSLHMAFGELANVIMYGTDQFATLINGYGCEVHLCMLPAEFVHSVEKDPGRYAIAHVEYK